MEEGGGRKKKEKKKGKGRRRRKKGRRCLRRHVLFRCRRLLLRVHVPPTPKVYEPSRSGCRPSRRLCVDGLRAGIVDAWAIVPQMWTSAIVPTVFLAGYRNLPVLAPCSSPLYTILFLLASTEDVLILLIIDAWPMRTCLSANSTVALNKLRACCLTCD